MRKLNASLTIEAAIITPLVVLLFAMAIDGGIRLFEDVKTTVSAIQTEKGEDIIQQFYRWEAIGELLDGEDKD